MLAIIGGSSLVKLPILEVTHRQIVRTPYGDPSCPLLFGRIGQQNVVFMARHGYGNSIAPHEINYRANIWALQSVGASSVVAISSVGSIRPDIPPGSIIVPDDLIDYTWGRKHTFFEGPEKSVIHIDFTLPFDNILRSRLIVAARAASIDNVITKAIYGCTQGPRLETAAEIRRLQRDGVDIVGMTAMPEASLARELNMSYSLLALSGNWAAGLLNSVDRIQFSDYAALQGVRRLEALLAAL